MGENEQGKNTGGHGSSLQAAQINNLDQLYPAAQQGDLPAALAAAGHPLTRRAFLASLAAAGIGLAMARPALSAVTVDWARYPAGQLRLHNVHTNERGEFHYRDASGTYRPEELWRVSWLLRCHYDGKAVVMDYRLLEFANLVGYYLGGAELQVVSGYRSPEYNSILRTEGHNVARNSLHQYGMALDIRAPGRRLDELARIALAFGYGGVGTYGRDGFVHIDCGPFRRW